MAVRSAVVGLVICALVCTGCVELLGARTARRAGLVHEEEAATAAPVDPDADLHPVILAYRESLRPFLGESEAAALDELDWAGTAHGDAERLRFLAADRAVRRVLPLVLEGEGNEILDAHAARLRALPPLLNRDTDLVAQSTVVQAMTALDRARRGEIPSPPRTPGLPVRTAAAPGVAAGGVDPSRDPLDDAVEAIQGDGAAAADREAEAELAEALAEYAVEYSRAHGVSAVHGAAAAAAASDAMDVAFLVGRAMETSGARERILQEAMSIADDLCGAARRRERLPRLHQEPPPAASDL